jgi:hypothetical protein
MKKNLFLNLLFILGMVGSSLNGQVVITSDDMPDPGDTLRVSITAEVPQGFMQTGRDTVWDFSMLSPMNQKVDTFVNVTQTPSLYWLFFVPNVVANLASPKGVSDFFPGFPVEQYYTFYKNEPDGFFDAGFAFTMMGIPIPAKYDQADLYYSFPLDTNSNWNSASEVTISMPGLFHFSQSRNRTSFVDGWGTVLTPFGTFETIRVRSALIQHDSLWVDSLGFGMGMVRNITEFKWMSPDMGIPVIQINQEGQFVTATYRDSTRINNVPLSVSIGPDTTVNKGTVMTLNTTVSGGVPPYQIIWSTLDTTASITVTMDTTTTFGVLVIDALNTFGSAQRTISVVSPGIDEMGYRSITVYPNPVEQQATLKFPDRFDGGEATLISASGMPVKRWQLASGQNTYSVDCSDIPAGIYCLHVVSTSQTYISKIIKN